MDTKNIAETEELAKSGGAQGSGVNEVFSRVYCAVQKTLGVTPYAEQLGAALALAALAARGSSRLDGVELVRRGYAELDRLLAGLGAQIWQEIPARRALAKKTPMKKQFCLAIGAKK